MNLYLRLLLLALRRRRARPVDAASTTAATFRVTLADIDQFGHMNNGRYPALMDLGRLEWMQRTGLWTEIRGRGWSPAVTGQTIVYRRQLLLGQRFELRTRYVGGDALGSYMEQAFMRGDVLHAHAVVRTRFVTRDGGRVPEAEVSALAAGDAAPAVPAWVGAWSAACREASDATTLGGPRGS